MKKAFTLAEVLITLGIVGVVAALTMPNLIANYKKHVWETQLKKDVSWIQNSIKKILADEGVDSIEDTSIAVSAPANNHSVTYKIDNTKFSEYFNLTPYNDTAYNDENSFLDLVRMVDNNAKAYTLKDGSCIAYFTHITVSDSDFTPKGDSVIIDVNCDRATNISGYDRFMFRLGAAGNFSYDTSNVSTEELNEYKYYCKEMIDYQKRGEETLAAEYLGLSFCSVLVYMDGWKIKY